MKYLLPVALLALAACDDPALTGVQDVAVVAVNDKSVTVRSPGLGAWQGPAPDADAKAREVCKGARYVSTVKSGEYTVDFLYLC